MSGDSAVSEPRLAGIRIGFVVPDDVTAWGYYRELMLELIERGAAITVISAGGPFVPKLREIGIGHIAVNYERFVSPLADTRLFLNLLRIFRREKFDLVQNITVKANLYGAAAAAIARVPTIINTVEGAGILWSEPMTPRTRLMRNAVEAGLKRVRKHIDLYWFVNRADMELYVRRGLSTELKSIVAISTGVDTQEFSTESAEQHVPGTRQSLGLNGHPVVTMVAGRLLKSKGIETFIDIADRLRARGVDLEAILVGPEEPSHPDGLDVEIITSAVDRGAITWLGHRNDIPVVYAMSDVVVTPTTYAEGVPKSVVEPMAMGKPVVALRIPSVEEIGGPAEGLFLAEPHDIEKAVDLVARLIHDTELAQRAGCAARATILERFDARLAVKKSVVEVYRQRLRLM